MKVYSWKTLLAVIFIGGPLLVHNVMQIREEFFSGIVMTVIALYLIVKGLYVSFTEEGYKEDQENGVRGKRVFRKLFGRFAPIMPYSVLLLFGLLAVIVSVTEISPGLILAGLLVILAYTIWFALIVRKHVKIDMEEELLKEKTERQLRDEC